MTKPKLNVRLLRKIQKHILEEPKRLDMSVLISSKKNDLFYHDDYYPSCNTVACISGWASILSGKRRLGIPGTAKLLGLGTYSCNPSNLAQRVFYVEDWPDKFRVKYNTASSKDNREAMAKVTARRIDHLIKEGK